MIREHERENSWFSKYCDPTTCFRESGTHLVIMVQEKPCVQGPVFAGLVTLLTVCPMMNDDPFHGC